MVWIRTRIERNRDQKSGFDLESKSTETKDFDSIRIGRTIVNPNPRGEAQGDGTHPLAPPPAVQRRRAEKTARTAAHRDPVAPAVSGLRAPSPSPLDRGVLSRGRARAPARGPAGVPPSSSLDAMGGPHLPQTSPQRTGTTRCALNQRKEREEG